MTKEEFNETYGKFKIGDKVKFERDNKIRFGEVVDKFINLLDKELCYKIKSGDETYTETHWWVKAADSKETIIKNI